MTRSVGPYYARKTNHRRHYPPRQLKHRRSKYEDRTRPQHPRSSPEAKPEEVAWLVAALRGEGKSLSAAQLAVMKFGNDSETSKRKIRRIASTARPRVGKSPGSDGYDLWAR